MLQYSRQHERERHGACAERSERDRYGAIRSCQLIANDDGGVHDDHRAARRSGKIEGKQTSQARCRQIDMKTARQLATDRCLGARNERLRQRNRYHQKRRAEKSQCGAEEECVVAHEQQKPSGQRGTQQRFQIVSEARQGQCLGVIALGGQDIWNRGLKCRCERG